MKKKITGPIDKAKLLTSFPLYILYKFTILGILVFFFLVLINNITKVIVYYHTIVFVTLLFSL